MGVCAAGDGNEPKIRWFLHGHAISKGTISKLLSPYPK
jgi:hypothetical protein